MIEPRMPLEPRARQGGGGFGPISSPIASPGTGVGSFGGPAPIASPGMGTGTMGGNPPVRTPIGTPERPRDGIPSFKEGTDRVEKTGPALLHKDEAVLKKTDADKLRKAKGQNMTKNKAMEAVSKALGGKEKTPKKEVKEIHIKKSANGGHIIRHEHEHPDSHPDETHTTKSDDELAQHVMQTMGTPNPGEQEADAGQSGIPTGAAPAGPDAGPMPPSPVGGGV
jgi:hypothetical protein